ncbi:MAG: FAD binding domain-containing protein [Firmicutes bacterium]|nr:FAD binding domain-containing protein [Bacillota bacterium]
MIFVQPRSIIELAAALAEKEGKTVLAAGCTDILPGKIGRPWDADRIIDLTHIPELQQIAVENNELFIGSCCTHAQIAENGLVRKYFKALAEACAQVGSVQIRNRGTIGGNVANASPAADTMPCLMLFGAEREVIGENGECITGFCLPLPEGPSTGAGIPVSAFAKLGDRDIVTVARIQLAAKSVIRDGRLSAVRVVLGAAGQMPYFCEEAAAVLEGSRAEAELLEPFAAALAEAIEAHIPGRSTLAYKRSAVKGPAAEILEKLAAAVPRI